MTKIYFRDDRGNDVLWDGVATSYGGLKIDAAWVAQQDATWARPFAAKLLGTVAAVNWADGNIHLDKNAVGKFRKQMFFPFAPNSDWKIDTCHGDRDYPLAYAKYHSGWDVNIKTGGNTDFNKPYVARADGIVVFVSDHAGGAWGGLVVVWHPQFAGFLATRYGHHKPGTAKVKVGDYVRGGETVLAHVGRGENNAYLAHLHMDDIIELPPQSRSNRVWWAFWPNNDIASFKRYYRNPTLEYKASNCATPLVPDRARPEAR